MTKEAPMARSPSVTSCTSTTSASHSPPAGYHTPIEEEEEEHAPLTPRAGSLAQTQAPTPCSALMTVSLDAYLDPQRMSFSSPPNSELLPRAPSLDESFPVFSPPPYEAVGPQRPLPHRQASIGPPWMMGQLVTPQQSISYSSKSPLSHHTCNFSSFTVMCFFNCRLFSVYTRQIKHILHIIFFVNFL